MMRLSLIAALVALVATPAFAADDGAKPPAKVAICGACHGTDGIAKLGMYPNLAGQYDNYIKQALHAYKSGERQNAIMNAQAAGLSDKDIDELAAWFSSRPAKVYTPSVTQPFTPKPADAKSGG